MKNIIRQILKEEKNILPSNVKDLVRSLPIELKELLFKQWRATQNEKWHPEGNTLKHIIIVLKRAYHHYPNDPNMVIASLFHDLGKMDTHNINPKTGKPTAYGHEKESVIYVEKFKDWIESFEGADVEEIKYIVKNHMKVKPKTWEVMKDSKKEPIKTHKSFEKLMGFTNKLDGGGINITETIKRILKEDRREEFLNKIIKVMKNDYPIIKNLKDYGFWEQLSKDELKYVLSKLLRKNIQFGYSYYTQILDESGKLLYIEVEDGCLEGIFVNYLEDDDNIPDSPEDIDYDCVWDEAAELMYYIEGFFDTELKSLSLDEFLHEYWDILNRTMKNDIMFLLKI
jgi:hypothetical protein